MKLWLPAVLGQGNHACTSHNLPMEKLDSLVLEQLAEKVFAPERLKLLMSELRKRIKSSKSDRQERVNEVNRQIKKVEERQQRLLKAIETALLIWMKPHSTAPAA